MSHSAQEPAGLPIRLSMDDMEPMYRQVEDQLRDLILRGGLPAGSRLPSVRSLAHDLSCSVITTRRAYQDLMYEGLIRTRQGLGAVVADVGVDERRRHRRAAVGAALREAVETGRQMGCSRAELEEIFAAVVHEAGGPGSGPDRARTGRGARRSDGRSGR